MHRLQSVCQKTLNLEVQRLCEISTFRFWLPVFLRYRLQNDRNAVSDNLVSLLPSRDLLLRPRLVRLLVGSHLPVKIMKFLRSRVTVLSLSLPKTSIWGSQLRGFFWYGRKITQSVHSLNIFFSFFLFRVSLSEVNQCYKLCNSALTIKCQ